MAIKTAALSYRGEFLFIVLFLLQVGVIATQLLLLILYSNSAFLFIGTCFLGLFISSVYPCMLAFTEDLLDYKGIYDRHLHPSWSRYSAVTDR